MDSLGFTNCPIQLRFNTVFFQSLHGHRLKPADADCAMAKSPLSHMPPEFSMLCGLGLQS